MLSLYKIKIINIFCMLSILSFPILATIEEEAFDPPSLQKIIQLANKGDELWQNQLVSMAARNPTRAQEFLKESNILEWRDLAERVLYCEGYAQVLGFMVKDQFTSAYPNLYTLLYYPIRENIDSSLIAHNVALIYYFGLAGKKETIKSIQMLSENARQGYSPSQVFLSAYFFNLNQSPESFSEGKRWALAASKKEEPMAFYLLGEFNEREGNIGRAHLWYQAAERRGIKIPLEKPYCRLNHTAN